MSFAVIQTGGKQYKVKASDILKIEKLKDSKPETKIEFNEVLAYGDDKTLELGSPLVKGAKVEAELVKNSKNKLLCLYVPAGTFNSYLILVTSLLLVNSLNLLHLPQSFLSDLW